MVSIFSSLKNSWLFFFLFSLFFFKIFFYILVNLNFLPISLGGADANYYHAFVLYSNDLDRAVNIWPVLLKYLHGWGFYSREIISYCLLLLNLTFIPIIATKLSGLKFSVNQKYYLFMFLLCVFYPSLYSFTFDIFRDVFMVFTFLFGCFVVKKSLNNNNNNNFLFFIFYALAILIGFFLLALRPYLGYAFLLSLFLWKIKFTKRRIVIFSFLYLISLFIANYIGLLDSLTEYRSGFEEGTGSTLGLNFSNPLMFVPNFILSILGQLFGLYFTNLISIVLFFVETVPFIYMLIYVFKNIRFADDFLRFLMIFFILYLSVWVIGNDNLGTAVRLRIYNYFIIYICFFYILKLKDKIEYHQVINK
ncbi:hypothetical protein AMQ28_07735 [Acinetobacter sp. TTH0-4]|uniref:hypothetical protein n=1 Tax=Acinetobacter sp. TTH0-4 TaxID=1646498 RepID=UPI0006B00280|nr:hypothetical protein [Acinetobacter sp. TTH0-4]ALD03493.1 hypothetical protein AMQ28_07735 [Acinetobacter sp. TTH0-4]